MHSLDDPPPLTDPTQTAVIVPVPAAEPVVDEHRQLLDRAAGWGVPAHVTVLYPFLPPAAVDDAALAALSAAVATVEAFDCTFARSDWFGSEVLWLAPDPSEPLRQLTLAVWAAFPHHAPYGGVHETIEPHLTVAERALGESGSLSAVEKVVQRGLPFRQRVDHVLLIAGSARPRSWRTVHRLPLGDGEASQRLSP
jgi:2'-5' RNA ligase